MIRTSTRCRIIQTNHFYFFEAYFQHSPIYVCVYGGKGRVLSMILTEQTVRKSLQLYSDACVVSWH